MFCDRPCEYGVTGRSARAQRSAPFATFKLETIVVYKVDEPYTLRDEVTITVAPSIKVRVASTTFALLKLAGSVGE
jgi:hypothetical protein